MKHRAFPVRLAAAAALIAAAAATLGLGCGGAHSHVVAISAGSDHSCALFANHSVRCWGSDAYGQLGNGKTSGRPITTAVSVHGLRDAARLSAGDGHSCVLLTNHKVECWGRNGDGQLGNGTTKNSSTPVPVSGITSAIQVTAGGGHSCALLANHGVKCWGSFEGRRKRNLAPVQMQSIANATAIAAGGSSTCAVLSSRGVVCWGWGSLGQLGNGKTVLGSRAPVPVSGIDTATAVSSGSAHSCALLSDHTISCWGNGQNGQLGSGYQSSAVPIPTEGSSRQAVGYAQVSAGGFHTCALLSDLRVECWGINFAGEDLGAGSYPGAVGGLTSATSISAGGSHTCALLY
ncbi:MAG: RCC1 domain-containing protein, partial [Gaiellaceae bacterium]